MTPTTEPLDQITESELPEQSANFLDRTVYLRECVEYLLQIGVFDFAPFCHEHLSATEQAEALIADAKQFCDELSKA